MLESLQSTQKLLLILHLQSMNMMGINYINSFSLIAESEAQYICIITDYAIRYMFTDTVSVVNSVNTAMI